MEMAIAAWHERRKRAKGWEDPRMDGQERGYEPSFPSEI